MKVRIGFVTNSSSTSFLLPIKGETTKEEFKAKFICESASQRLVDQIYSAAQAAKTKTEIDLAEKLTEFVGEFAYNAADEKFSNGFKGEWDDEYNYQIQKHTAILGKKLFELYPGYSWIYLSFEECSDPADATIDIVSGIAQKLFNS